MSPIARGLAALVVAGLSIAPAAAGSLTVAVSNVRSARGLVHVDICPAADFLSDRCDHSGSARAVAGTTIVTVAGLPPGRYAAQVFHDENGNGKVDRALFGIPKEGVGFSNDAPIRLSPPKFADAMFAFDGGAQTIRLKLRYFLGSAGQRPAR